MQCVHAPCGFRCMCDNHRLRADACPGACSSWARRLGVDSRTSGERAQEGVECAGRLDGPNAPFQRVRLEVSIYGMRGAGGVVSWQHAVHACAQACCGQRTKGQGAECSLFTCALACVYACAPAGCHM